MVEQEVGGQQLWLGDIPFHAFWGGTGRLVWLFAQSDLERANDWIMSHPEVAQQCVKTFGDGLVDLTICYQWPPLGPES